MSDIDSNNDISTGIKIPRCTENVEKIIICGGCAYLQLVESKLCGMQSYPHPHNPSQRPLIVDFATLVETQNWRWPEVLKIPVRREAPFPDDFEVENKSTRMLEPFDSRYASSHTILRFAVQMQYFWKCYKN